MSIVADGRTPDPLHEYVRAFAEVTPAERVQRLGAWFLLLHSTDLKRPTGPAETILPSRADTPTGRSSFHVLPLRKTGRSAFPHIAVGRTDNNDVVLSDVSVSKFHAYFRVTPTGTLVLLDAGSRNGTYLDHTRVPRRDEGSPLPCTGTHTVRFGSVALTLMPLDALAVLAESVGRP